MAKKNCSIYGPDLGEHEQEGRQIAQEGLKCMKGVGATGKEAASGGPDTSKNNLERLQ